MDRFHFVRENTSTWVVYDRKLGFGKPLAECFSADAAQKIVDALNRSVLP